MMQTNELPDGIGEDVGYPHADTNNASFKKYLEDGYVIFRNVCNINYKKIVQKWEEESIFQAYSPDQ